MLVAGAVLGVLPLYVFGPGNDLVMRASIPALMVIAIALAESVPRLIGPSAPVLVRFVALGAFSLGCFTPAAEIARSITEPRWAADFSRRVVDVTDGNHYLAKASDPRLSTLLRGRLGDETR